MTRRICWPLLALLLLLVVVGCGDSHLVKVTGRVTHKGQPVPSTKVVFAPDDGSRTSHGVTDDDGKFTLKFTRSTVGASRGPNTVFLTYDVSADEETHKIPPKASKELKEVILRYGDLKTSKLHYDVTKDDQFIEINLD
jgi:hypothetical protein